VQFCEKKFNHAYLAKYAAGIEEHPPAEIKIDANNNAHVNVLPLSHEKISK
jgi:hypothetical protein